MSNERTELNLGQTNNTQVCLPLKYANRHGLISGATGSGKTVSLQLLAEQFSQAGVSVVLPDIKGDLLGLASPGQSSPAIDQALQQRSQSTPVWQARPVRRWSIDGAANTSRLQASLNSLGPLLLASLMGLSDIQTSILQVVFRIAREHAQPIGNLQELRNLLGWIQTNRQTLTPQYGAMADSSISAMQRNLLVLEEQSAGQFITGVDSPLTDLIDTLHNDGVVQLIDATQLLHRPVLYASMYCWLLTRLFEELPEIGDTSQPKLVLFIDEAHLLFETLGKTSQDNLQRVVRLIRSRGVGIYFASQLPSDLPDTVLAQLGHRIQHVLRAFTPKDQKAVQVAARTLRPNPEFDMVACLTSLAPGEVLVSVLDPSGTPSITQRIWMQVPCSRIGANPATAQFLPVKKFNAPPNRTVFESAPIANSTAYETAGKISHGKSLFRGFTRTLQWLLGLAQ
jgi:Cdc6-like AAA superfamily ATPase